ncbi:unnamed protein product [Closterium sp. Naga37s-1]|nr:unnamed protein product [Closterium sp. Naga37s-1]
MTTSSETQPQEPAHTAGPEVALVFIGVSLALGALCRQVLSNTRIPYTVALLLVGVGLGALEYYVNLGLLGESIRMWANIDPELVLYVFLPALLFESAFSFEFHQVKRCLVQMFLLAVPGVAISTGFLGVISRYVLPYGWNWSTAMLLGGLLSATDPVAVVALLRDLGASKKLSTIIDGEALMNDGTAIVVFQLFLRLTLGYSYGIGDVIGFLFKVTLGGVGLGMAFGVVSLLWLRTVFSDPVIEITISLTASYMAFFVANDVAQTSGVLSDMTLGIMFAIFAKTAFTGESEQGMHHFWEMVSYISNTLIFVLSGVVISESILQNSNYIKGADWGYMILLYVFVQLSRVVVVGVLYPGLASSGYGLTWKEAIILVWSGLRGAVALTLALLVSHEPVTEHISKETEARFMFLTGGVVFLTLIVNGSTTQFVLAALKMNATSDIKKRVVSFTKQELCEYAVKTFEEIGDDEELGPAEWATVNEYLTCLKQPASHGTLSASAFLSRFGGSGAGSGGGSGVGVGVRKSHPHDHSQSHEQLRAQQLHDTRLRFLNGVQAAYWSMLEEGRVNQTAAMLLMQAVAEAVDLTTQERRLLLWKALEPHVRMPRYLRLIHRRLRKLLPQRALNWVNVDRLELAASMSAAYIRALRHARQQLRDFLKDSPICEAVILESEEDETPAKKFMEDVRLNFPEVLTIIKTKQVTHAILQGLHGYVENLEHAGLLDQREVMHLHKAVQADMKKLQRSPPFVAMLPAGEVLARQPLIGALPADIRVALLQPLKEATKLSGASLFHEGQPAQGVWLIASVDVSASRGGSRGAWASVHPAAVCTRQLRGAESCLEVVRVLQPEEFGALSMHELRVLLTDSAHLLTCRPGDTLDLLPSQVAVLLLGSVRPVDLSLANASAIPFSGSALAASQPLLDPTHTAAASSAVADAAAAADYAAAGSANGGAGQGKGGEVSEADGVQGGDVGESDRLLGGGSENHGGGGGGGDGRVENGLLVAIDAPALLTAQPLPAAAPERAVYGDSAAMLHGRYSALSLCKLLVIHMPRDLMSVQNTPTRSFHVHRPQATHDHDGLLRFGAEGAEESTLNEALLAAMGAGEHAGEEGGGGLGEEGASEMTMPRGSELAAALRDRAVVDQALTERAMELSVFGSKVCTRQWDGNWEADIPPVHVCCCCSLLPRAAPLCVLHLLLASSLLLTPHPLAPHPSLSQLNLRPRRPTDTSPHHHYSHVHAHYHSHYNLHAVRVSPAPSPASALFTASQPHLLPDFRRQVGQQVNRAATSSGASARKTSDPNIVQSMRSGHVSFAAQGQLARGGAHSTSLSAILPSLYAAADSRTPGSDGGGDGGGDGDHQVDAMASKAAFVLLALLAAAAFCHASRPLPADSDNSVTIVAKDNDNTVTVVPADSDNTVAVVPADNDNTVAVVPADNDNTVAVVPADNDNTVAVVPADNDNTVAVVPADNDNTVAVIPADNDNMVAAVPADKDNMVAVVPADNDNTVAVVPADNDNTVAVVPADNDNTVAVVPADNDNTVAVVPADNDNTVAVVPADNDNTVAVVPAEAEDNVAVAQPSSDVSPKIAMVTKASVAAVDTVASNAGGLTKRSVAGSNGNAAKQFTMDEVSKHNRPGDAWVVVQNKVYDVSDFADQHPGGRVIYLLAGRNATDVFAVFHKPSTSAFLATLYIGDLKDSEVEPTGDLLKDFRDLRSSFEAKGYFKCSPAYYLFKVLSTFAIVAASIAIIMGTSDPRWVLVSGVLLGLYFQQVGWLSHDFLHHQVFQSRSLNTFIGGYIHGNLAQGFSMNWWKNKHATHHAITNECDKEYRPIDPDIDTLPYLAWSEDILATVKSKTVRSLLRYQSYLFLPTLFVARFAWSYASLTYCFSDEVPAKERFYERLFMVLHYAWVLGFGFGCLPFWTAVTWLLTAQISGGLFLSFVFVQSHNAMEIYNEGKDFYTAQIVTTRNVSDGLFNDWFTGGLNKQLEHHLFPTMPRHHLGKTCKAVKELCEKHGLAYEKVSFAKGTSLVLEHLSKIAEKA